MERFAECPIPCKRIKLAKGRVLTILDMNFYILVETFKYLDGKDLYELHKAHPWFHDAIYFVLRTKDKEFCVYPDFESDAEASDLLSRLGGQMRNICISMEKPINEMVHEYCMNGNIEKCTITCSLSPDRQRFAVKISKIFVFSHCKFTFFFLSFFFSCISSVTQPN